MPHIATPDGLPGIAGLAAFKPAMGEKLFAFADELLRGPSSLTAAERELIATVVSTRNDCTFCARTHQAVASHLLDDGGALACALVDDVDTAPVDDKMRALLRIATEVVHSGRDVHGDDIAAARAAGATDEDIHDTVLVAAAFCMFNRYVDGLAAVTPDDDATYDFFGTMLAAEGYKLRSPS